MAQLMHKSSSTDFTSNTDHDDLLVLGYEPLIQPALLNVEVPLSDRSKQTISQARRECAAIIDGKDDRILVVVGPCSVHNPDQAVEYARRLKSLVEMLPNLVIVMRCYPEKPRTTVGWKGLINDPDIDGSFHINKGLRITRQLYVTITDLGMPVGVELLDTISPQFLGDCISWGAIGARTTESQLHRELASGTSAPVGFKNGTLGDVGVAIDAMRAASHPHAFMGINSHGLASIVKTKGNSHVHLILRGATTGPNFSSKHVQSAKVALIKAKTKARSVMIDCSHGNSQKDHRNQPKVLADICDQLRNGEDGINGVMIESFFNEGRQDVPPEGVSGLKYGISITDACVNWETTVSMLNDLNEAAGVRRKARLKVNGVTDSQA